MRAIAALTDRPLLHALALALALAAFHALALALAPAAPAAIADAGKTAEAVRSAAANLERGRKLYELSCDACHSANVHWRDQRLVDSWPALLHQVDRWQRISSQRWDPADVNDVAAYLNERFYQLPCPANECAPRAAATTPREPRS